MKWFIVTIAAIWLAGCTSADRAQMGAYGTPGHIVCYSGGQVILDAHSTGKISTESQSDGWFFEDSQTHRLVRVSGACVIRN